MTPSDQNQTNSGSSPEPREAHPRAVQKALSIVQPFISGEQIAAMLEGCKGEEKEFFIQRFVELSALIGTMPVTYEQDGKGDEAIAHLHYFFGGSDWYITEKDMDGGVDQAFGFVILNGDTECAELGYISIAELVANGVELDLYWTPTTLREIKVRKGVRR